MRAVVIREHGGPEVLTLETDFPDPEPGPGETLVRVRACGLNHLDVFVRRGMPGVATVLPHISGGDVAGTIVAHGEGSSGPAPGTRVLVDPYLRVGRTGGALGEDARGGLAELVVVPTENVIPLPATLSDLDAAALPIAYGTALRMLVTRGAVRQGETVVVLGASGGVGTAAVQIARAAGCRVAAVTASPWKRERLLALGAELAVDHSREDWSAAVWEWTDRRGADVVVDHTGRDTWRASVRTLAVGGRILCCGATSGYEAVTDLRYLWRREATIVGSNAWERADLEELIRMVGEGAITPVVDRVVGLEGVADAERAIEAREVFGKVVVTP